MRFPVNLRRGVQTHFLWHWRPSTANPLYRVFNVSTTRPTCNHCGMCNLKGNCISYFSWKVKSVPVRIPWSHNNKSHLIRRVLGMLECISVPIIIVWRISRYSFWFPVWCAAEGATTASLAPQLTAFLRIVTTPFEPLFYHSPDINCPLFSGTCIDHLNGNSVTWTFLRQRRRQHLLLLVSSYLSAGSAWENDRTP